MATKRTKKTTGVVKAVHEYVNANYRQGEEFHNTSFEMDGVIPGQISNAFCYLTKKGMLEHGALKGYYRLPPNSKKATNPAQAIYDLLDFMAKAEPSLKRAAKILEAVEGAR